MKRSGKTLACVLSALAVGNGAQALVSDSSGGPYHGIVARNVFDIHAPVPHDPALDKPPTPPPPNIRLQGITDILHKKQVIFKVQLPPKPPAPAKEESYILTEGQREGEIEVLEIDVKAGTVKMSDYGIITNLSIELNGEKLVSGPPAGVPGAQPQLPPPPGTIPSSFPTLPAGRIPPRTLRLPGSAGAQTAPPANSGFSGASQGSGNAQTIASMSPEAQALMVEAERLRTKDQVANGSAPALPYTPATPKEYFPENNPGQTPVAPQ